MNDLELAYGCNSMAFYLLGPEPLIKETSLSTQRDRVPGWRTKVSDLQLIVYCLKPTDLQILPLNPKITISQYPQIPLFLTPDQYIPPIYALLKAQKVSAS